MEVSVNLERECESYHCPKLGLRLKSPECLSNRGRRAFFSRLWCFSVACLDPAEVSYAGSVFDFRPPRRKFMSDRALKDAKDKEGVGKVVGARQVRLQVKQKQCSTEAACQRSVIWTDMFTWSDHSVTLVIRPQ